MSGTICSHRQIGSKASPSMHVHVVVWAFSSSCPSTSSSSPSSTFSWFLPWCLTRTPWMTLVQLRHWEHGQPGLCHTRHSLSFLILHLGIRLVQLPEDFACWKSRELSCMASSRMRSTSSSRTRTFGKKQGFVGKLIKAVYGTRSAPMMWQKVVREKTKALGFRAFVTIPYLYYHQDRDVFVVVHVDDFLCKERNRKLSLVQRWIGEFVRAEVTGCWPWVFRHLSGRRIFWDKTKGKRSIGRQKCHDVSEVRGDAPLHGEGSAWLEPCVNGGFQRHGETHTKRCCQIEAHDSVRRKECTSNTNGTKPVIGLFAPRRAEVQAEECWWTVSLGASLVKNPKGGDFEFGGGWTECDRKENDGDFVLDEHTISSKMITVLKRYRPIVFELKCSRNDCNFHRRPFFWISLKP